MALAVRSSTKTTPIWTQAITCNTPAGATSGDKLVAFVFADNTAETFSSSGWTEIATDTSGGRHTTFERTLAAAPPANYTFDLTGGVNRDCHCVIVCLNPNGVTWGTSVASDVVRETTDTAVSEAVTGVATDSILLVGWGSIATRTVTTPPPEMTSAQFSDGGSADVAVYTELAPGAGSLTRTLVWGSSTTTIVNAVLVKAAVGPTIDTQPTAQTARLNGDATKTATLTVAATTSGGALTYDWELEDGVASGVYANVADGSGATWTGQAATSCVGTFTATTLSGRRLRCNVTDSNGTTTTNAVALTVLNGPVVISSSTITAGTGVGTLVYHSDDPLTTNGEMLPTKLVAGRPGYQTTFYLVTRPSTP